MLVAAATSVAPWSGPTFETTPRIHPTLPIFCDGAVSFAPEIVANDATTNVNWWIACDGVPVLLWTTVQHVPPAEPQVRATVAGIATHYGRSYHGQGMGCGGTYDTNNPAILAVSPQRYADWPCGTKLRVRGPSGDTLVERTDACPGCRGNHVDLSEAGFIAVCGSLSAGTCRVELDILAE